MDLHSGLGEAGLLTGARSMKVRVIAAQLFTLSGLLLSQNGFTTCVAAVPSGFWSARRLEVHEWGVSEYDWSQGGKPKPEFPNFFYSSRSPGTPLGISTDRVKDMESRQRHACLDQASPLLLWSRHPARSSATANPRRSGSSVQGRPSPRVVAASEPQSHTGSGCESRRARPG